MSTHGPEESQSHATWKFYVMIGVILGVVTGVEVAIFYIEAMATVLAPTLMILSAAKFLLVVMFFMHLKFDSGVYTGLFVAGMALAVFMVGALILLYHYIPVT